MRSNNFNDIPPQESREKWFKSHLLSKEIELKELYEMSQQDLDLLMAETAELRSDIANRERKSKTILSEIKSSFNRFMS